MPNPPPTVHHAIPIHRHTALKKQRTGWSRPFTFNPGFMPRFPFLFSLLLVPGLAEAAPQDLRHFDDFIHHVRQEAQSGDAERIADCFAPFIVTADECEPERFGDALGPDAMRFGWSQVGRDIARFADGFVLVDVDGTMTNLHARAAGHVHCLDILGNRVKFRREAGSSGDVMAILDAGTLPGSVDPTRWTVTRDGVRWTPVVLHVPEMGKLRGYIGEDYVRPSKSSGDVKLTARYDGQRWALTGYQRTRPELAVKSGVPKP